MGLGIIQEFRLKNPLVGKYQDREAPLVRHFLIRDRESGKQDLFSSCESLRAQFRNACCLMLDA